MQPSSAQPAAPPHFYLSDGWLEFNRRQWGVSPHRAVYRLPGQALPRLEAALLLNRAGRICQPPLCPELPLQLVTASASVKSREQAWFSLAPLLAADLRRRGIHAGITLPVGMTDARPLSWAGLRCTWHYSAVLRFPYSIAQAGTGVRRAVAKAKGSGYSVRCPAPLPDMLVCLNGSAKRAGFIQPLDLAGLELAQSLLGAAFRPYVCYSADGHPAAARGILFAPGHLAVDWLTGTVPEALQSGATQFLVEDVLRDLAAAGASGFDFEGANLPGVGESKLRWGAELTPLIGVEQLNLRNLLRDAWRMVKLWRSAGQA